ncbi:hypothetical protein KI387_030954, partial [Taxus chinensis]
MSRFFCAFHPWEEIVGVCSACLRERLLNLTTARNRTENEPRRLPDLMSSCGCLNNRKRKNGGIYYKADGIRDRELDTEHAEKKGSKIFKFSGLRSLFGFMRKEGKHKAAEVDAEDRSGDVLQDFYAGEDEGKSCILKSQFSSARHSVSVRRSTAQRSALKRSTSCFDKELHGFNPPCDCEQNAGK